MSVINQLIGTNYTPGRGGNRLQWIVLHTVDGNAAGAVATFNNPNKARSAHDIICLNGNRVVCVGEGDTSWGAANWPVNQGSINIEHEDNGNYNDPVRTNELYATSAARVADLCRRYGIPCQRVTRFGANKLPLEPGIVLHKEVSQSGTACPDGLDDGRIIRQAQAILGGATPVPPAIPAASEPHVNYQPANDAVTVVIQTLLVRELPTTDSAPGQANTPDGNLHAGNTITITGFTHAQDPYGDGRDVWLRTVWGHWIWAYGTNYAATAAAPAPAAPAPVQPEGITDYTPIGGSAKVVVSAGLKVHTAPNTAAPLNPTNTAGGVLGDGEAFTVSGYKHSEDVDLTDAGGQHTDIWLRSQYGNWLAAAGTNFTLPATPPAAAEPTPAAPAVPEYEESFNLGTDTKITAQDSVAHDFEGKGADKVIPAGATVNIGGVFTVAGKGYVRTAYGVQHNTWYGIPLEAFKGVTTSTVTVTSAPDPQIDSIKAPGTLAEATDTLSQIEQDASLKAVGGLAVILSKLKAIADFLAKLLPGSKGGK